jgi:lysophospholipase L1-like esterase
MIKRVEIKRIAIGASLTLTALTVIGAAWLMTVGYLFLAQEIIIKPHYARAVTQFKALPVESGDTVFLGDSLTEFGMWTALFPDTPVRNRGIVGDDTAGVLARLDEVTAGRPAQVFLMIGTNDLTYGVPHRQIVANVERIVSAIKADSPRTEVFVQSLLPRAKSFRDRVESLNRALRSAVEGDATWIDLYPHFLDADGSIADRFSNDELHLFGSGYLVWRDAIQRHVSGRAT